MFVRCTCLCIRVFVVVCIREMYMLVCTLVASVRCTYLCVRVLVVVCCAYNPVCAYSNAFVPGDYLNCNS